MESIGNTPWRLLIEGTGLAGSLLALSLSRTDKKILHVDRDAFYGGAEAALSLQDAVDWAARVADGKATSSPFSKAEVVVGPERGRSRLGFSRSYSLALAPQIVYTRSALLPALVSSKTYRQLEFLAVGSWFVFEKGADYDGSDPQSDSGPRDSAAHGPTAWPKAKAGQLVKIPASREDVFADRSIDTRSKRSLIKFLRLATDPEAQTPARAEIGDKSLGQFLAEQYALPEKLQSAICALTLSPNAAHRTPASWALPRISRHLASVGVFGPGFGSVIAKWGGLSEIAQVGCRALAVGGGTYMLGHGVEDTKAVDQSSHADPVEQKTQAKLSSGDVIGTEWLADVDYSQCDAVAAKSVTIVASSLPDVFPPLGDGAPPPAAAVVIYPSGSILDNEHPVYLFVHTSDTGECPAGQCVVYASTSQRSGESLLRAAVSSLLSVAGESNESVLWTLQYTQRGLSAFDVDNRPLIVDAEQHRIRLRPLSLDPAFDDGVLRDVRDAWMALSGQQEGFLEFDDREVGAYDDDD